MGRLVLLLLPGVLVACEASRPTNPAAPAVLASTAPLAHPPPDAEPTTRTPADLARERDLAARAGAILDAYANVNGPFTTFVADVSADGRVLFGSMRSGVQQIYLGDLARPADAPVALTRGPERAMWASFTRDGKSVLFTRDQGADERWRIYRVGTGGGEPECLTPGDALHRDEPLLPRGAPQTMLYTEHDARSRGSRLVVQPVAPAPARVVAEDDAPTNAVDVTADGGRVLLVRFNSASDLVVLESRTEPGSVMRRVYPPEGARANVTDAVYAPDGKIVYVATDEGKEGGALLALDAATGAVHARYAPADLPTALVTRPVVSPAGDRVVVRLDAGNHDEIRVLDGKTLAFERTLTTPLGSSGLGAFTRDGKGFTFWRSSPDHPADVERADPATGQTTPLRSDPRPGLEGLAPVDVTIEALRAPDGLAIPVNVLRPRGDGRHPVLVWFHGGPSNSAAVRWHPFGRFFTSLGYVVVEPNVRGSTGFGRSFEMADDRERRPAVLDDMATVNAWVRGQPWADPRRVVVFGGSYGGYLTLMALTRQPAAWSAGVDLYGIPDLRAFMRATDPAIRSILTDELGDPDRDGALLDALSPSRDYGAITAPLFVYAGQNDPRVPRSESDRVVLAMRARGLPVEYMVAPNEGHSVDRRETRVELLSRVARFLADHAGAP